VSFPKIGLYAVAKYTGAPFVLPDGTLDPQVIEDTARFGTVIVEAYVILQRPEIAEALRAANPALRLIAFMDLEKVHAAPRSLNPATDLRYEMFRALADVSDGRGILLSAKDGWMFDPEHLPGTRTPWSSYAAALNCTEAVEALASVVIERVIKSGLFDGVFFDLAQHSIIWASSKDDSGDVIDTYRAGFAAPPSLDFDAAYREGHRLFFRRLHDVAEIDDFVIEFNCSDTDPMEIAHTNGQMDEGFPSNPGGGHDWLKVMQGIWTREEDRGVWTPENWINMTSDGAGGIPFGLGSACMTNSARFTCSGTNGRPEPDGREKLWHPLYDIDLGDALGPAMRGGVKGTTIWVREFTRGAVIVDPARRQARFYGR